jgi:peptide/nickel transport system substrate-binding protein
MTTSLDEALSREVERGMTREDLFRRAAALGIVVAGGSLGPLAEAALASTQIKRGGTFRLGITGGGSVDFIDGQHIVSKTDISRLVTGWESLARFNQQYLLVMDGLAEEITAEKPNRWVIRVRNGIEFHNGKTLTAEDVMYSIRRTLTKKLGLFGLGGLSSVDPKRMKKLDKYTVRLLLSRPDANLIDTLAQYFQGVVPVGYPMTGLASKTSSPLRYVGTGAYKVQSFTPGRQSVHVRNENYWRSGQPYFDKVIIIDFPDTAARVNALLSGQVDAITDVPYAQVPAVKKRKGFKVYESVTGAWNPISMRLDAAPFTDVRVRQAMRLLINRPQVVQQALSGHGTVANDIYSPFDASYAGDEFPQHKYDPEKARSLLKAAGQEGLTVDLQTTDADTGMVEEAQILAQNAKAAGVTVNVKNLDGGTFYGDQYLKWPFATDYWGTRNYLTQVAAGTLKGAAFDESHWYASPQYAKFFSLYKQALSTVDAKKRAAIIKDMQRLEYNGGGHIIAYFKNLVDGHSTKLGGLTKTRGTLNLDGYGHGYRTIYFV